MIVSLSYEGLMEMKAGRLVRVASSEAATVDAPPHAHIATPVAATPPPAALPTMTGSFATGVASKLLMDIFVDERTGKLIVATPNASGTIFFVGGEPAHVEISGDAEHASLARRLHERGALKSAPSAASSRTSLFSLGLRSSPLAVLEALRDEVRDFCRAVRDATQGMWAFYDHDEFLDDTPLTPVNTFGLVLEARRRSMQPQEVLRFANDVAQLYPWPLAGFANATSRVRAFTAHRDLAEHVDGTRRAGEIFEALRIDAMMGALVLQALVDTKLVQLSSRPSATPQRDRKRSVRAAARPALVQADGAQLSQLAALPARGGAELLALYLEIKPERDLDRILGIEGPAGPATVERCYEQRLAELDPRAIPPTASRPYLLARAEELRTKIERAYRARTATRSRAASAYRVLDRIGVGGMAEVYRGCPTDDPNTIVAIKFILPELRADPQFSQMFIEEARLARRVQHPNVVRVLSVGKGADDLYLAMEYVDGLDMAELVRRARESGTAPPWQLVCRVVADACAGLHAAHTARDRAGTVTPILHRDVSAQNILVSRGGDVKLSDFGIAKAIDKHAPQEQDRVIKGKIPYVAPEMLAGHGASVRSDVYAMAMTVYACLARLPFSRGDNVRTMEAILRDPLPPLSSMGRPDVPPELDHMLARAAARNPDERHASAQHLQLDLEELLVVNYDNVDVAAWSRPLIGDRVVPSVASRSIAPMPSLESLPVSEDVDVAEL